jgi:hypothetical protein
MHPSPAPIGVPEFLLRSPPAMERPRPTAADPVVGPSPLATGATTPTSRAPQLHRPTLAALDALFRDRVGLRAGFVLSELLGPPLSLREPHEGSWL